MDASEFVEVSGSGGLSQLSTRAFDSGNAGDLKVTTGRLILRDGGQILSSTEGAGTGGTVIIDASESVKVSGSGETLRGEVEVSGLFAETKGTSATGNGGVLRIDTERLVVQGGGSISVAAVEGSTGQAGTLDITASESVELSGTGSTLLAESESPKPAGDLTISTGQLIVRDGAKVSVSSSGKGNAGNLGVNARSMRLDNQGKLIAETVSGNGENITLGARDLLLMRRSSQISTTAGGAGAGGDGGNIDIDTNFIVAVPDENSDITANSFEGRGGNINITNQGIFGIEYRKEPTPLSDITASSQFGTNGSVKITPDVDLTQGLVELPAELVDASNSFATGCSAGGEDKFIITGRGGLPPNPRQVLSSNAVQVDWVDLDASRENRSSTKPATNPTTESAPTTIVEANGWTINDKGDVVLTATAPTANLDIPWLPSSSCNAPEPES